MSPLCRTEFGEKMMLHTRRHHVLLSQGLSSPVTLCILIAPSSSDYDGPQDCRCPPSRLGYAFGAAADWRGGHCRWAMASLSDTAKLCQAFQSAASHVQGLMNGSTGIQHIAKPCCALCRPLLLLVGTCWSGRSRDRALRCAAIAVPR